MAAAAAAAVSSGVQFVSPDKTNARRTVRPVEL